MFNNTTDNKGVLTPFKPLLGCRFVCICQLKHFKDIPITNDTFHFWKKKSFLFFEKVCWYFFKFPRMLKRYDPKYAENDV